MAVEFRVDFFVENHGTIFLLRPNSDNADLWVNENIPHDAQWHGNAVVVEHRYIADIIDGIEGDGLVVK